MAKRRFPRNQVTMMGTEVEITMQFHVIYTERIGDVGFVNGSPVICRAPEPNEREIKSIRIVGDDGKYYRVIQDRLPKRIIDKIQEELDEL